MKKKKQEVNSSVDLNEESQGDGLTDKRMKALLSQLVETEMWKAVERYMDDQCVIAANILCTVDAFKEPTIVARNQGYRMALMSFISFCEECNKKLKESSDQ